MRSTQFFFLSLLVFSLIATTSVFASPWNDGGMSGGGGGGTAPGRPITQIEVAQILSQARLDIYMALALFDQSGAFLWPGIFEGKKNIYNVILQYQIYGSREDCRDNFGNSKDGSIYSPVPKTICISLRNLSQKLTMDNARAQILALVAHEYSHLLGFDEYQAVTFQKVMTDIFANSSSDQATNVLDYMTRQSMDLGDSVAFYDNKKKAELSWDYLCYVSEKMENALIIIEQQFTDRPYTVLPRELYKKQNSYLVKHRAIKTQVCAKSQFHPQKMFYQKWTEKWFGNTDMLYDQNLADEFLKTADYDVSRNILIVENLPIRKINDFNNFDLEFKDMKKYIYDDLRIHLNNLWSLSDPIIKQPFP